MTGLVGFGSLSWRHRDWHLPLAKKQVSAVGTCPCFSSFRRLIFCVVHLCRGIQLNTRAMLSKKGSVIKKTPLLAIQVVF